MSKYMGKDKENLLSQGNRIPQGAVGLRDIVPVPDPSSSNDGQKDNHERGRGWTTGTLVRRKRRLKSILISSSEEEEDIEAADNNRPDKPDDASPPVLSPERKKGTGNAGRSTARRGRGRPPTTGDYVGLAAAKEALLQKEREVMELQAERELNEEWSMTMRNRHEAGKNLSDEEEVRPGSTTKHLCGTVDDSVKAILHVAKTSGKLKGTYIKILKEAAAKITEAVGSLKRMTVSEETGRLEKEVARLGREVRQLREEKEDREKRRIEGQDRESRNSLPVLRRGRIRCDTPTIDHPMEEESTAMPPPPPPPQPTGIEAPSPAESRRPGRSDDDVIRTIIDQVGQMMDARFAALEGRLLPEKSLRPPLGSGRNKENLGRVTQGPGGIPAKITVTAVEAGEWVRVVKKGKDKKPAPPSQPPASAKAPKPKPATAPKPKAKGQPQRPATTKGQPKQRAEKTVGRGGRAQRKIRPPKAAAVVLTLEQPPRQGEEMELEEGETPPQKKSLGEILASVKSQVSLEEIGVGALRPRRAATGALILEIPGPESSASADKVAARLRTVLEGKGVRVARPVKTEDLRVSGLDDSVSRAEVESAVSAATGCPEGDLKVGEIRRSPSGLGTVWLRCPSLQAKKLADARRLKVGWVAARVEALQPRALHCFRCLERGHTRSQCKATVDRSGRCYRCGQEGHTAGTCANAVRCPLCADQGKPAEHRFGGQACSSSAGSAGKKKKKGPAAKQPAKSKGTAALEGAEPGKQ